MTLAGQMILAAALLPYGAVAAAKWSDRGYDNHDPAGWARAAQGWRARLVAAQRNGFEGFALFAAAVLLAQQLGGAQGRIDLFAVLYVVARLAYTACYALDWAALRSVVWALGFLCVLVIFLSAA